MVLCPAAASAGKKVVSGDQSLQIKARLSPDTAGARQAKLHLQVDDRSVHAGKQPSGHTKNIILILPSGMKVDPSAAPACKRSDLDRSKGNPAVCPAGAKVGGGTLTINAAPAVANPIPATVTFYNAINNVGEGQPAGTRNLIMFVKASLGITALFPFRITKAADGRVEFVTQQAKPAKPGYSVGDFTIQHVDVSISGRGKKSYLTNPPTCTGSWAFTMTITAYYGVKSITARDRAPCRA